MSSAYLRRYSDLPALVYLLHKRAITFLDPKSWDDRNDIRYLNRYLERKNLKSLLALCFTQAGETYHHWRVFANGASGVCIRFRHAELMDAMKLHSGIRRGVVKYLTLAEIRSKTLQVRELPFLKRHAFENEHEFRIIYESTTKQRATLDIAIPLSCIDRIVLSPWLPLALTPDVKRLLRSIPGCGGIHIVRSNLINNEEWKSLGDSAT